jgi:hypothetical protein
MADLGEAVAPPSLESWPQVRAVLGDAFFILFYQNWSVDDIPRLLEMLQQTVEDLEKK